MINNLIEVKVKLDRDPKTNRKTWSKIVGKEISDALIDNGYIKKEGTTKGAKWHWVGATPTYQMEEEIIKLIKKSIEVVEDHNYDTFIDVFIKNKIPINVGKGVEVLFCDDKMKIKKNKKSLEAKTPEEFNNILRFLM